MPGSIRRISNAWKNRCISGTLSCHGDFSRCLRGGGSSSSAQNDKVEGDITVWTWEQPGKEFEASAKLFEKKYPGTKVTVENVGNPAIWDKITTGLAAGGQGLPDIMNIGIDYIGGYVDKFPDAFVNLNDYGAQDLKSDFPEGILESATVNNNIYGLPFEVNTGALLYDVGIFEKADVNIDDIKTWDDYLNAGKQIKDKTGDYLFYMDKAATGGNPVDLWQIITMLQGTFYFNDNGEIVMNNKNGVKSMELLKEANDAGLISDIPASSEDSNIKAAKAENVASFPDRNFLTGIFEKQLPEYKNRWRVTTLPAVEEGGLTSALPSANYLSIANSSKNKKTAWEFIKFTLATQEAQSAMYKSQGLFPGYIPFLKSDDMTKENAYYNNEKINDVYTKQLEDKTPKLIYTSDYAKAKKALSDAQTRVLTENADPKQALDEAAQRLSQETGRKLASD